MPSETADPPGQTPTDKGGVGLEELILSLMNLIHDLLEKQVIRRMNAGHFSEQELDRLGRTLFAQDQQIDRLCEHFAIQRETLDLLKIFDTKGLGS